jgi:uncharacterized protein
MFPLGSVLFPHAVLPLHVFEPRYRQMIEHCIAGDGTFGVVLIERGHEVGGGDARFDVGTRAQIVQAGQFEDGRYAIVAVGLQRLRVRAWLPDDPYPCAEVELLDDVVDDDDAAPIDEVTQLLQRVFALHAELGAGAPADDVALPPDPELASFEAAARSPIATLDAQALLELDGATARLTALLGMLQDEIQVLEFRLGN